VGSNPTRATKISKSSVGITDTQAAISGGARTP